MYLNTDAPGFKVESHPDKPIVKLKISQVENVFNTPNPPNITA